MTITRLDDEDDGTTTSNQSNSSGASASSSTGAATGGLAGVTAGRKRLAQLNLTSYKFVLVTQDGVRHLLQASAMLEREEWIRELNIAVRLATVKTRN